MRLTELIDNTIVPQYDPIQHDKFRRKLEEVRRQYTNLKYNGECKCCTSNKIIIDSINGESHWQEELEQLDQCERNYNNIKSKLITINSC